MNNIKMKHKIMISIVSTLLISILILVPVYILIVNYQHEYSIKKEIINNNKLTIALIQNNSVKDLDLYFKALKKSNIRIALMDNKGKIIKDSNVSLDKKDSYDFKEEIENINLKGNYYSIRYSDSIKDVIAYYGCKLKNGDIVISSMPMGKVLGFQMVYLKYYFIAIIIAFIVAFILSSKLATIIVKPIKDLKYTTSRIANGDLKKRVEINSNDELGELSKTFNDMADKLQYTLNIKSQFVANVSHELKTPLTSIKGFAETLRYVEDKKTRDRFLGIIDDEVERLTRLINDILTLSHIERHKYFKDNENIDVVEIIKDIYELMESYASKKDIKIHILNKEHCMIYGNKDEFKEMIINILDNAIKYSEAGDKIFIEVKNDKNNCMISIEDTGVGIKKEHIPRLFERFYRVDKARSRSSGGTGLGLAIVKHIVMEFNGEIYVQSEIDKGTKFTIKIPLK